jgi:phenylpropionate dioxygenase-like ring-hydroxylating dioxygenase large terminal subunit
VISWSVARPSSALDNVDARLAPFWHPVGLASEAAPAQVTLLGRRHDTASGARLREHLGMWWFAPEPPRALLPRVPEDGDARYVRVASPPEVWTAGAAQMADNFLDIGHLPYLHRGSFADASDAAVPRLAVERSADGFTAVHRHRTRRLHGDGLGSRVMTIWFTAPFSVMMRLAYLDDDAVITAGFFLQPLDEARTRLFALNWRDDIHDGRCTPEQTVAFQQQVAAEDRAMLELLPTRWVPLDLRCEVHTRADATTIEMRRTLARLLGEPDPGGLDPGDTAP